VLRECEQAHFCCSQALGTEEFYALLDRPVPTKTEFSSGVDEFRQILKILKSRGRRPRWAVTSRRILPSENVVSSVWTLSPADGDISLALESFASINDPRSPSLGRIVKWDHHKNEASVVILIEVPDAAVLLGGDLEHIKSRADRGWHGVINDPGRPQVTSTLYKVAHHGSITAHCDAMWGQRCKKLGMGVSLLRRDETLAILAPWRRGRGSLPTDEDKERLTELSRSVWITKEDREAFGDRAEARQYLASREARYLAPMRPKPGIVRCRRRPNAEWTPETLDLW
jgi:hypothetical protein